jgi:hypothetical protein
MKIETGNAKDELHRNRTLPPPPVLILYSLSNDLYEI